MGHKLSDQEIRRRLQEGRNYKRLYYELKEKYDRVTTDLRSENEQLRQRLAEQAAIIESQAARIEQLEAMVFGRRPKGGFPPTAPATPTTPKLTRSAQSYRRPIPDDEAVTAETYHGVTDCQRCGGRLTDRQQCVRYVEDIILPSLANTPRKTVEKQTIERGWCPRCGHYSSAMDLRGQLVSLGPQVRLLITYLDTIQGLTYGQIQSLLSDLYDLTITDGEIATVLCRQRQDLLPVYQELATHVRAGPSHFDETRYRIQSERGNGYTWVMAGANDDTVIFRCSDSRGKGTAKDLIGDTFEQIGITDRYSAYKHLFAAGKHQICWAHLERNARDLTRLECLAPKTAQHVVAFYRRLSALYALVRHYHDTPFDPVDRQRQATDLLGHTIALCQPHRLDPKGLTDLKAGIRDYQDSLFVCLTIPGVPPDNNKAERHIRKLVLKRARSFGVKTKKGAQVLEVLMSVCWSLWYRDRSHFFQNLQQATQSGVA